MITNKIGLAVIAMMLYFNVNAQELNPVKWDFYVEKINEKEAVICFRAIIDHSWHIYSQYVADGGPIKTEFIFKPSADYELIGKTIEPEPIKKYYDCFSMVVNYFETRVIFRQKVKIKKRKARVSGNVTYMVDNDVMSIPPDEAPFSLSL